MKRPKQLICNLINENLRDSEVILQKYISIEPSTEHSYIKEVDASKTVIRKELLWLNISLRSLSVRNIVSKNVAVAYKAAFPDTGPAFSAAREAAV